MKASILVRGAARALLPVFLLLAFPAVCGESAVVTGVVRDAKGAPVSGAVVAAGGAEATTGPDGTFRLSVPPGRTTLLATRAGFAPVTLEVTAGGESAPVQVVLPPLKRRTEEIVVQAVRAEADVPVTKTDIGPEELARRNTGREMPALLEDLPGVTQYSDTGLGAGYDYLSLRGVGATRVNFTLDGVPLAEPEDSALYFVDFGDFASSLDSVQVQRGVGTSSVGPASFVGSVNFASLEPSEEAEVSARLGAGSFDTYRGSVGAHSGRFGPGLKLYVRGSWQETDGFRERSGVEQRSLFAGLSHETEASYFKLFGFAGREETQLAYLAADEATLAADLRFNPMAPEERDRFGQQFLQAQYTRFLSSSSLAAQAYYNGASGWYRVFGDPERAQLLEYGLSWRNLGAALTWKGTAGSLSYTWGAHASDFASDHSRDLVGGARQYENRGHKNEANTFVKLGWDRGPWHLYGDAQLRWARFRYEGDLDLGSVSWTFFNPKLGARYDLTPSLGVYGSVGRTTREPARADMFAGEDNPTIPYDLEAVSPERVTAVELGVEARGSRLTAQANLFAMEMRDEIALTGELSEIGLPLRRNVDRSFRRGVEWDASWRPLDKLRLRTSGSLSWARIAEWSQSVDVYDADGAWANSRIQTYEDVRPLLTPPVIVNLAAGWDATPWLTLGGSGRYVSRAWLDNTNSNELYAPDWVRVDASASADLSRWVPLGRPRLRLEVTNLLDAGDLFASGYSYLYRVQDASGAEAEQGIRYFYPLATRAFQVLLDVGF